MSFRKRERGGEEYVCAEGRDSKMYSSMKREKPAPPNVCVCVCVCCVRFPSLSCITAFSGKNKKLCRPRLCVARDFLCCMHDFTLLAREKRCAIAYKLFLTLLFTKVVVSEN